MRNLGTNRLGLTRETFAQLLNRCALLFLADLLVLLLVRRGSQTLPRQSSAEEVHEDMAQRLQVVTSRLLAAQVGVDRHIPSSAR